VRIHTLLVFDTLAVNVNEEMGNRISSLEVIIRLAEASWNAIGADMLYTVATDSFIARGQDGYLRSVMRMMNLLWTRSLSTLRHSLTTLSRVNPPVDEFSTQSFAPLAIADGTTDETLDETTDEPVDETTDPMYGDTTSSTGKSLISLLGITTTLVAALAL
jgi:hypothetical protein